MNLITISIPYPAMLIMSLDEAEVILKILERENLWVKDGYGTDAKFVESDKVSEIGFVKQEQLHRSLSGMVQIAQQVTP